MLRTWELVVCFILLLACNLVLGRMLYEVTWLPISENWHQCHRITLCNRQR